MLNRACKKLIKAAHAPGTRENHRTHHKAYIRFCNLYKFEPFPADEWQLCQFAQFLADEDKVPQTVQNYVSSVKVMHKVSRIPVPEECYHYSLLDHQSLLTLFKQVDLTQELEAVTWVAVLVGFTLVLRVSNLGPETRAKFDPTKNLTQGGFPGAQGTSSYCDQMVQDVAILQQSSMSSLDDIRD